MKISSFIRDPTILFTIGCLSVAPVLTAIGSPATAGPKIAEYLADPALLAGLALFLGTLLAVGRWGKNMDAGTTRVALWYLVNGAFIHVTMDGLTGGWHFLDLLNQHYCRLDRRFLEDESVSWMITQIELFIMAPLCMLTYRAIVRQSPLRYPLEIVTSLCQMWGAMIFFGSEILNKFPNVPVDSQFLFTFDHCLYFWFGFGANLIWVVIPLFFILRSFFELANAANAGRRAVAPTSPPKKRQ